MTGRAVTLSDVFAPAKDVAFREIDREVVILDLESGSYFGLNSVGSRAWMLVTEGRSLQEVHDALLAEYDVPSDQLQRDLLDWARRLLDKGLLHVTAGPPAKTVTPPSI